MSTHAILAAVTLLSLCANLPAAEVQAPTNPPSPVLLMRVVADAVLRDFPEPPPFDWGEGVLLAGMLEAHRVTKDARYLDFVRRFSAHWSERGIGPLLAAKGYCGHWGPSFAMLQLHERTGDAPSLRLANEVVEFITHHATRTSDGGLDHFTGKPELWVDTLAMCCPVLANQGRLAKKPELQVEARRQFEVFARHLQDPATGLFYHHWSETTDRRTTNFWARGNGWVAMSLVETLKNEPVGSGAGKPLRDMLVKQLASLAKLQDPATGLWRTILDAPETYPETSASAMFLYAALENQRRDPAKPPSLDAAAAWRGLAGQVNSTGRVIGVSGGTGPSPKAKYAAVPTGTYTWGTGAFLLAAGAYWQPDSNRPAVPEVPR